MYSQVMREGWLSRRKKKAPVDRDKYTMMEFQNVGRRTRPWDNLSEFNIDVFMRQYADKNVSMEKLRSHAKSDDQPLSDKKVWVLLADLAKACGTLDRILEKNKGVPSILEQAGFTEEGFAMMRQLAWEHINKAGLPMQEGLGICDGAVAACRSLAGYFAEVLVDG